MKQNVNDEIFTGFAERFTQACKKAGLESNKAAIGRAFDLSRPAIVSYMDGKSLPSVAKGIEIARKLNVSFEWLMTGKDVQVKQEPLNLNLIKEAFDVIENMAPLLGEGQSNQSKAAIFAAIYQYLQITHQTGKELDFDGCLALVRVVLAQSERETDNSDHTLRNA